MTSAPTREQWLARFAAELTDQAEVTQAQAQAIAPRIYQSLFVLPPDVAAKLVIQIRMLRKPDLDPASGPTHIRGDRRRS